MIPEIGQFALILALALALVQGIVPLVGAQLGKTQWEAVARPAAAAQFGFMGVSFLCLTWAFIQNDFSVLYVANNSNSMLPIGYRIAAVWGAHEGSLLLWTLALAAWTVAVAYSSRHMPQRFGARVIGVMGLLSVGFYAFTLFTSNPFERLVPAAPDGADLNPLLQDPALVIHPPMLYIGYVGFAVAFAFAVAAMLEGKLDRDWARWTRPWTTAAWMFLTIGIALGSWWAYYELGWGGWWFWDPVENASFMPWLVGTALIHSLAVTEKRGLFKSWTLLLAITAFSLSLLGTFLVRSGVLVSVHAFASDPARGAFILAFLAIVVGSALGLYAWRAPQMDSDAGFKPLSRETFLLLNNVLLVITATLVLLGTLYPLFLDGLGLGKISVGPPFFDLAFIIPMLPLALLIGIGMSTAWRSGDKRAIWRQVRLPLAIAVPLAILVPWLIYGRVTPLIFTGMLAAFFVSFTAVWDPLMRLFGKRSGPRQSRAVTGMQLAHLGVGMFVIGVVAVMSYGEEVDMRATPGETIQVAGYDFTMRGLREVQGANYDAMEAEFEVRRDGELVTVLTPQKRVYRVRQSPMTEASIDAGWHRDLFVALGDSLGNGAWSVRIQYKPLIRWIWFGCAVMALGGIVAMTDRRYRVPAAERRAMEAGTAAEGRAAT